jgi:hypothetical protein
MAWVGTYLFALNSRHEIKGVQTAHEIIPPNPSASPQAMAST